MITANIEAILSHFETAIQNVSFRPIHQGYINDTFLILEQEKPAYILQRINKSVFQNIEGLHANMTLALKQLKAPKYASIQLFLTREGQPYLELDTHIWRLINYIEDSKAYNYAISEKQAFEAGRLLGTFHHLLSHENMADYEMVLPNLNALPHHYNQFQTALKNSETERLHIAETQIEWAQTHVASCLDFYAINIPLRLCHNDTKLNNFLFDASNDGLCLIDLDTLMPGCFHFDFGDAIRTVVSGSDEDEKVLEKIAFNLVYFEAFIKGLRSTPLNLNAEELIWLPKATVLMPLMHGLRALTDYLNGNLYYKVSYETQNLDRCKSLFQVAHLAQTHQEAMQALIQKYWT